MSLVVEPPPWDFGLWMLSRLRPRQNPEKKRPQPIGGKLGPESTGREVPHVGTIQMWARNPPIPLNFALGNPNSATRFEHLAQATLRKAKFAY